MQPVHESTSELDRQFGMRGPRLAAPPSHRLRFAIYAAHDRKDCADVRLRTSVRIYNVIGISTTASQLP
jgi:hypothetical protein